GQPIPARVHLKDSENKPHRPERWPFWRDHFVCDGKVELTLANGTYRYEVERGPEYTAVTNSFAVQDGQSPKISVTLQRLADLAREGWWSGEMHVHRAPDEVEMLMRAEDLHVAQVITWWNKQNRWTNQRLPANPQVRFDNDRFYDLMAGEDERDGGALLFFGLAKPHAITSGERFYPHSLQFAREIRQTQAVWVDIEKPFWWDFPAWVAAGVADSVGIANNHMYRTGVYESEAWGRPRDTNRFPAPLGNGQWTQEIYYHLLNCGVRLPPSAGSASGVLPNPVGYDRVYVHVDGDLTWTKWWDGLRAGRVFVSNGPLLRCRAEGQLPGQVFKAAEGKPLVIQLTGALSGRDPVKAVEIVRNGTVLRSVSVSPDGKSHALGQVMLDGPGWFLIRAIADQPRTFRFASTGPFYVEGPNETRRISRASAQFFVDWVHERMAKLQAPTAAQREEVLQEWRRAEKFWQDKLAKANAE
ncbi:MAG: CehA/McbA family metallohydrolase, partial [Verrucomicrobiales bacterium]|nr:CehA/McbA family metallohydrolase [Verrucomicrobiales bacterium]